MADGPGRPTLFTEETRKLILDAVLKGNYRKDAVRAAGVSIGTLRLWMGIGRKEKQGPYFDFMTAIEKAEIAVKSKCVEGVLSQGEQDARFYQWYLERKFPEDWGKDRLQIKQLEARMAELEAKAK